MPSDGQVYPCVKARREQRHMRLVALGYRDYPHYLKSPAWKQVKARYRASDQPQDCICGSERVQLHHMTYERVGAEELTDLTPLCGNCHAMIHALERRGDIGLDLRGFVSKSRALGYMPEQRKRQATSLADQDRAEKQRRKEIRSITQRMRAVNHEELRRGLPLSEHWQGIEAVLDSLEKKVKDYQKAA